MESNAKRVTIEQKTALVEYLEENVDFAHDRFVSGSGARSLTEQWSKLADTLNGIGGAFKTGEGWKRAWANIRSKTKQKAQELKSAAEKSGINGMASAKKQLTDLDQRVIGVMNKVAVTGQIEVPEPLRESGLVAHDIVEQTPVEIFEAENAMDEEVLAETPAKKTRKRKKAADQQAEKFLKIEEQRLALKKRKIEIAEKQLKALEERNLIEKNKTEAIANLSSILLNFFTGVNANN